MGRSISNRMSYRNRYMCSGKATSKILFQDVPLYYELPRLTSIVKQSQHKLTKYTSAILNAGYKFSIR